MQTICMHSIRFDYINLQGYGNHPKKLQLYCKIYLHDSYLQRSPVWSGHNTQLHEFTMSGPNYIQMITPTKCEIIWVCSILWLLNVLVLFYIVLLELASRELQARGGRVKKGALDHFFVSNLFWFRGDALSWPRKPPVSVGLRSRFQVSAIIYWR